MEHSVEHRTPRLELAAAVATTPTPNPILALGAHARASTYSDQDDDALEMTKMESAADAGEGFTIQTAAAAEVDMSLKSSFDGCQLMIQFFQHLMVPLELPTVTWPPVFAAMARYLKKILLLLYWDVDFSVHASFASWTFLLSVLCLPMYLAARMVDLPSEKDLHTSWRKSQVSWWRSPFTWALVLASLIVPILGSAVGDLVTTDEHFAMLVWVSLGAGCLGCCFGCCGPILLALLTEHINENNLGVVFLLTCCFAGSIPVSAVLIAGIWSIAAASRVFWWAVLAVIAIFTCFYWAEFILRWKLWPIKFLVNSHDNQRAWIDLDGTVVTIHMFFFVATHIPVFTVFVHVLVHSSERQRTHLPVACLGVIVCTLLLPVWLIALQGRLPCGLKEDVALQNVVQSNMQLYKSGASLFAITTMLERVGLIVLVELLPGVVTKLAALLLAETVAAVAYLVRQPFAESARLREEITLRGATVMILAAGVSSQFLADNSAGLLLCDIALTALTGFATLYAIYLSSPVSMVRGLFAYRDRITVLHLDEESAYFLSPRLRGLISQPQLAALINKHQWGYLLTHQNSFACNILEADAHRRGFCLDLTHLESMRVLPPLQIPSCTALDLTGCSALGSIASLKGNCTLRVLKLVSCDSLSDVSALDFNTALTTLHISDCKRLNSLPRGCACLLREIRTKDMEGTVFSMRRLVSMRNGRAANHFLFSQLHEVCNEMSCMEYAHVLPVAHERGEIRIFSMAMSAVQQINLDGVLGTLTSTSQLAPLAPLLDKFPHVIRLEGFTFPGEADLRDNTYIINFSQVRKKLQSRGGDLDNSILRPARWGSHMNFAQSTGVMSVYTKNATR